MYKWVPGGAKWDSGVLKINTGYWHMVSPDELGFMDRIRWYVDVGVASVRNWTTRQLTPPPGMTWGIIPPQVLLFLTGGEISQIQDMVNTAGRPLTVVGSTAAGTRGPGSDIDITISPSSRGNFPAEPGAWPPGTHVFTGMYDPAEGPGIVFQPGGPPTYLPGGVQ